MTWHISRDITKRETQMGNKVLYPYTRIVKWSVQQLMEIRQKHKLKILEEEKLQTNIYICKLEQGSLLGDEYDDMSMGSIPIDDAANCSEDQHEDLKTYSSVKLHSTLR